LKKLLSYKCAGETLTVPSAVGAAGGDSNFAGSATKAAMVMAATATAVNPNLARGMDGS
jgi:hypothetical protein